MSISFGTYTVGGVGSDYPGTTGLDDALKYPNMPYSGLTGDLTLKIRGPVTVNEGYYHVDLNGYTLLWTCDTGMYHNGDFNSGVIITHPFQDNCLASINSKGTFIIEKVILAFTGYAYMNGYFNGTFYPWALTVRDYCIKNCNSFTLLNRKSASCPQLIYDNKFLNTLISLSTDADSASNTCVFENNTVMHDTGSLNGLGVYTLVGKTNNWVIRNSVFVPNYGTAITLSANDAPTGYNNATSDGTAQSVSWKNGNDGEQINIAPVNEFKSVVSTSADFLKLKDNHVGVLGKYGIAPTYAKTDIAGNAIPDAQGYHPIGCHISFQSFTQRLISVF